jgi:adenine-specific DNA-methyltransferase
VVRADKSEDGVAIFSDLRAFRADLPHLVFNGSCLEFLRNLPNRPIFDLVVTSPPYNVGKPYEQVRELAEYRIEQRNIITELVSRLKPTGSLCWQVGNFVYPGKQNRTAIYPLDYLFHPLFTDAGLVLRNRIVWRFGHGLHCRYRLSGRYEVILWYTKDHDYFFDLNRVRVPSKYPAKKHYKGPNKGRFSGHPRGKNPEDVWVVDSAYDQSEQDVWNSFWDIPNVKSNHIEKQLHPCQFPVGLVERLVLALTSGGDSLVFDPFAGVGSSGVASAHHKRKYWACETMSEYAKIAKQRIENALDGTARFRPHDKPIYDHTKSPLSKRPSDFGLNDKLLW